MLFFQTTYAILLDLVLVMKAETVTDIFRRDCFSTILNISDHSRIAIILNKPLHDSLGDERAQVS